MKKTLKPRYTLIKGKFWIHNPQNPRQGPQPDGDTIRFEPDSLGLIRKLPRISGRPPNITANGQVNVRYEGVDTLETHFNGRHQDLTFANAAREFNLTQLGFTNTCFFQDSPNVVQSVDQNPLPGHVIANGIEANSRLLGLVFSSETNYLDGDNIFVDNKILEQSVNAKLVVAGLAYVEPYDTMPMSLVQHLRALVHEVRNSNRGLWSGESVTTDSAALIKSMIDAEALIMWPKLFRRLTTYFDEGYIGLGQFDAWIRDDPIRRDDTLRLPDGEKANMHDTYLINNDKLKLQFRPEDLLITPDPN